MSGHPLESPGRIGRVMVFAAWILAAALLTFVFDRVLDRQHNPNRAVLSRVTPDGAVEVELTRNRLGHYVAGGSIDGYPVTFLLDTGATHVSVPAGLAERIGLRRGRPMRVRTANGSIETYVTRLARVRLGEIEMRGVAAGINPHMDGDEVLLGMNFLKHLEIEQRGRTLTLRQLR